MTITESKGELTAQEKYFLTAAPNIKKMRSVANQTIDVDKWCMFMDTNKAGEENEILSIMTPEREVYATNSRTFIESFYKIVECFGTDGFSRVEICTGTSKAGREFITAVYAG